MLTSSDDVAEEAEAETAAGSSAQQAVSRTREAASRRGKALL